MFRPRAKIFTWRRAAGHRSGGRQTAQRNVGQAEEFCKSFRILCEICNLSSMRYIFALLLPFVWLSCVRSGTKDGDTSIIRVGDRVPGFYVERQIPGVEYANFSSPADFEGRNTLLVLFSASCGDCRREMPFAGRVWQELGPEEVRVVCISRGYNPEHTPQMLWEELGLGDMPWFVDPDGEQAYGKFAKSTVPRFYLVDRSGKVVWMRVEELGYGHYDEARGGRFVDQIRKQLNQ